MTTVLQNLIPSPSAEILPGLPGWSASIPTRTNLVTNPSFENGTTGWSPSTGTITKDTGWAAAGSASGRYVGTVTSNDSSTFGPAIPVTAGTTYAASVVSKIGSGTTNTNFGPRLIIQWDDGSNAWALGTMSTAQGAVPAIGTVTALTVTGAAPAGATQARFRLNGGTTTGTQIVDTYWDAVQFVASASALAYFDGDTTGYGWTGVPHASTSSNAATVTNLVPNPSLETGTAGWSSAAGGFITAGATLTQSSAQAYLGTYSGYVQTVAGSANQGIATSLTGTFVAGVTYTARCRIRGAAGGEPVNITIGDQAAADSATSAVLTATTAWQEISVAWTPTANRTAVTLAIRDNGTVADSFYVETVAAFAGINNTGYFDGTFPGASWTGTAHGSTSTRSAAGVANRFANPGFESATFSTVWVEEFGGTTVTLDTGTFLFGTQSAKVVRTTTTGSFAMSVTSAYRVPVVGGETITYGGYVKTIGASFNLVAEVLFYDSAGTQVGATLDGATFTCNTTTWTRVSGTFTVPAGAVRARSQLRYSGGAAAAGQGAYFDGMMFVSGTSLPAYFDGSTTGAWRMGTQHQSATVQPAVSQSSDWAASGTKSVRYLAILRAGDSGSISGPSFSVTAGQQYGVSTAYNVTSLTGSLAISVRWSDGTTSLLATVSTTGTGTASGVVTAPAGVTSGAIQAVPSTAGLTDMYLDAQIASLGSTVPVYFDGSSPGASWTGTPDNSVSQVSLPDKYGTSTVVVGGNTLGVTIAPRLSTVTF